VQASEVRRAVAAAMSTASSLGLVVDDAVVLSDSNRLVLRLTPCDVVARVAPLAHPTFAEREVELVQRLAETNSPVAPLDPRVEPRVHVRDGFVIGLWAFVEPVLQPHEVSSADYTHALMRLHAGMRKIDVTAPNFMERVAETQHWVEDRGHTPGLSDADRVVLADALRDLSRPIVERGATEQLLHGEPHPWNVLGARNGPLFIDFENCVRGPVEYDLGWVPEDVAERYPGADRELVRDCRGLMVAIVAVSHWRWYDQHPGNEGRAEWLSAVRAGPPWSALEAGVAPDG
jgi:hypothetical protein